VAGAGGAGRSGGTPGDLYLVTRVSRDPVFERRGDHLHTQLTVPLTTAVLGGEVRVPTLTGAVQLKIPAGTQPGQQIRLRGQGMPLLRDPSKRGDLFVTVAVQLPNTLDERARKLFEELRAEHKL
jgi:curved DNA-binding protein